MANLGLFALNKIISEYAESIWRILGKNLSIYGEDAKRLWRIPLIRQETQN